MTIAGKLEVTIKINELPDAKPAQNGWMAFDVDCSGTIVSITVKPKIWKKLTDANENFPMFVAAIAGTMGSATDNGFVLENPNVQVFEKKPKEPKGEAAPQAIEVSGLSNHPVAPAGETIASPSVRTKPSRQTPVPIMGKSESDAKKTDRPFDLDSVRDAMKTINPS